MVSHIISWVSSNKNKIRALTGYSLKRQLGNGAWGVVYRTNKPNIVLKVTAHREEAKTVANIIRLRQKGIVLPGIANFISVAHFWVKSTDAYISGSARQSLFFIVREYLGKCSKDFDSSKVADVWTGKKNNQYKKDIVKLTKTMPNLGKTLELLAKNKIYLWDIRQSNMGTALSRSKGRKKGEIVIHDVVAIRPLPRITIKSFGRL
jgi:hypothetical protein